MKNLLALTVTLTALNLLSTNALAFQAGQRAERYVASIDVKDGDVIEVLNQLFRQRAVNYVIREGVQGKVTCTFHNFDWDLVVQYVAALVRARVRRDTNGVYVVEPVPPAESPVPSTQPTASATPPATPPSMTPRPPGGDNETRSREPRPASRPTSIIHIRGGAPPSAFQGAGLQASVGYAWPPIITSGAPLGYGFPVTAFGLYNAPQGYALQYYNLLLGRYP